MASGKSQPTLSLWVPPVKLTVPFQSSSPHRFGTEARPSLLQSHRIQHGTGGSHQQRTLLLGEVALCQLFLLPLQAWVSMAVQ